MHGQAVDGHDTKMLSAMLADSASSILSEGKATLVYNLKLYFPLDSTIMDTTNTMITSHRSTSRRKKKRRKKKPVAKVYLLMYLLCTICS